MRISVNFSWGIPRRCLADGLLLPSAELEAKYQVLRADLFEAYGEEAPTKESIRIGGVPFVQSIPLGGGLCAQAVCFMASCVLHEHTSGIHGLGEISAIASNVADSEDDSVVPLGGLEGPRICDYFGSDKVDLSANIQTSLHHRGFLPSTRNREWMEQVIVARAIDGYVGSNIPVIALVNARKLQSFYRNNGIEEYIEPKGTALRHTLLVVGTLKREKARYCFLVNDPSHLPFMEVTISELFDARVDLEFPTKS